MEKAVKKVCRTLKLTKRRKEILGADFVYVVRQKEKSRICFGSGQERKIKVVPDGVIPNLSPAMYPIHPYVTAMGRVMDKPTSNLGTCIGGRTSDRSKEVMTTNMLTPAPGEYEIQSAFRSDVRENKVPFNVLAERMKQEKWSNPPVGTYKTSPSDTKHKTINYRCSFGGRRHVIPAVETKCTPCNSDTCTMCGNKPVGDYWKLDLSKVQRPIHETGDVYLCRPCYQSELTSHQMFNQRQLPLFHKYRDCSRIHEHEGCQSKIMLVTLKEQAKLINREAYLNLYFLP